MVEDLTETLDMHERAVRYPSKQIVQSCDKEDALE